MNLQLGIRKFRLTWLQLLAILLLMVCCGPWLAPGPNLADIKIPSAPPKGISYPWFGAIRPEKIKGFSSLGIQPGASIDRIAKLPTTPYAFILPFQKDHCIFSRGNGHMKLNFEPSSNPTVEWMSIVQTRPEAWEFPVELDGHYCFSLGMSIDDVNRQLCVSLGRSSVDTLKEIRSGETSLRIQVFGWSVGSVSIERNEPVK